VGVLVSWDVQETKAHRFEIFDCFLYGGIKSIFILDGLIWGDLLVGVIGYVCDHPRIVTTDVYTRNLVERLGEIGDVLLQESECSKYTICFCKFRVHVVCQAWNNAFT